MQQCHHREREGKRRRMVRAVTEKKHRVCTRESALFSSLAPQLSRGGGGLASFSLSFCCFLKTKRTRIVYQTKGRTKTDHGSSLILFSGRKTKRPTETCEKSQGNKRQGEVARCEAARARRQARVPELLLLVSKGSSTRMHSGLPGWA